MQPSAPYLKAIRRVDRLLAVALRRADGAKPEVASLQGSVLHNELRTLLWHGRRLAGSILGRSHGDLALEELLAHADWSHPAQVLESPRPTAAELLAALRRLEDPPRQVSADRFAEIEERLELLARIEKRAGRRRGRVLEEGR